MSLADLSSQLRSSLKWFLVAVAALIVLWFFWLTVRGVFQTFFKPKGEYTAFGVIAPPAFSKTFSLLKADSYELSAQLPKSSEREDAFQFFNSKEFSDDDIRTIISLFGLTNTDRSESEGLVALKSRNGNAILKINTKKGHFNYRYDYVKDKSILSSKTAFDKKTALREAGAIVTRLGALPKDINDKNVPVVFLNFSNDQLVSTEDKSGTIALVLLYRQVGDLISNGQAPMRLILTEGGKKIVEFDYYYSPLNSVGAPYPIITSEQAWSAFQAGGAFTEKNHRFTSVKVNNVALSYFESHFYQPYLQPVWVFSGSGQSGSGQENFTAYFPAINPSFLSTGQSQEPP